MIEKVSHYYKTLFNRINAKDNIILSHENTDQKNVVSGVGIIIYNSSGIGTFGIKDDEQNEYYIINDKSYLPLLKDRRRVRFCLEPITGVANIAKCKNTALLHSLSVYH